MLVPARVQLLVAALVLAAPLAAAQTTFLSQDEEVEFLPADARLDAGRDVWIVPVHVVVSEPEHDAAARQALLRSLAGSLRLPTDSPQNLTFQRRARPFLADHDSDMRLVVQVAGRTVRLDTTGADGHVHGTVEVPGAVVRTLPASEQEWLPITLLLPPGDQRTYSGWARLLPAEGLSVISDLGDTALLADVKDRKRLITRIFLEPLAPVPDMAPLYARCAAEGADFHYISSGPWQLHAALTAFLQEAGFPRGPLLLRELRAKETEPFLWFDDEPGLKRTSIAAIAEGWPERRLILVGDSGDLDPELYGDAARRWPDRIERILIRDVTGDDRDAPRYQAAFRDVPPERWSLFKLAKQLDSLRLPPPEPVPASSAEPERRGAVPPLR
jgi:phosphatidate phosphatase APP1